MEIKKAPVVVSKDSWAAQAERKVRQILDSLPMDHFIVMNDVRFKYGNIDHLVIRDDGRIFLIETKCHRGAVSFDGKQLLLDGKPFKDNYIAQMNRNMRWLKDFIGIAGVRVWFTAILVFPNAVVDIGKTVKGVILTTLPSLMNAVRI